MHCVVNEPCQFYSSLDMDSSMSSFSQPIIAESLQDVQRKANAEPGSLAKASLFVTDLDASVTETDLYDLFGKHGQVLSVKICREICTGVSRGYGFVNYSSLRDATKARKLLNFEPLNGTRIRVMLSNQDSNLESGGATIFFKGFDKSIDAKFIDELFSTYGTIITSELAIDSNGKSKGFGYVMFNEKKAAEDAIHDLEYQVVQDCAITIGPYICKEEREREKTERERGKTKFQNYPILYVKNMTTVVYNEEVQSAFCVYGRLVDTYVVRDDEGYVTGSGFVVFENFDEAVSAIKGLNGKHPSTIKGLRSENIADSDPVWYVGWANSIFKTKGQRQSRCEKKNCDIHKKLEGVNLYIKNLDDNMTEKKLKLLFSDFGMIIYSKIMLDSQGLSRGYGFVGFVTPEDATKAMNAMNGKFIGRKPLHVSVARRRKEKTGNILAVREQCCGGTMFTRLANGPPGELYETEQGIMELVPWYQNIQEAKVGEAVDYTKFSDWECDAVEYPHPSYSCDSRVAMNA